MMQSEHERKFIYYRNVFFTSQERLMMKKHFSQEDYEEKIKQYFMFAETSHH